MYAKLVDLIDASGVPVAAPRLRACFAGGAPLDPALKANVERVLGVTLHNGYGLTEAAPTIAHTRLDAPRSDCAVGRALPGVGLRIVDPRDSDRRDVPAGEPGELWVRGPNVMRGYYRNEALTARTIDAEGWLNTGDLARCDPDGTLFIVGPDQGVDHSLGLQRLSGGSRSCAQCASGDAAVGGGRACRARQRGGGRFRRTASRHAVRQAPDRSRRICARLLAPYKLPAEIHVVPTLPVAANGKVLKHRLAELARQVRGECVVANAGRASSDRESGAVKSGRKMNDDARYSGRDAGGDDLDLLARGRPHGSSRAPEIAPRWAGWCPSNPRND